MSANPTTSACAHMEHFNVNDCMQAKHAGGGSAVSDAEVKARAKAGMLKRQAWARLAAPRPLPLPALNTHDERICEVRFPNMIVMHFVQAIGQVKLCTTLAMVHYCLVRCCKVATSVMLIQ